MKRLLTLALSVLMLLTSFSFVGCFGQDKTEADESGKVQLNVAYANLGYGDEFYKWVCQEFENKYTKYDVQVKANDRTSAQGNGDPGVAGLDDDLVFYGFQKPDDYRPNMIDITDIYSVPAYDENYNFVGRNGTGATVTLADRMSEKELNMINYNDMATSMADREIFGVPLQVNFYGLWYDVDLFEEKGLYAVNAARANILGYKGYDLVAGNADDCYGPDHTPGTTDDGLPATWEDMKALLAYMKKANISARPFVWSGQHVWMSFRIQEQIAMSYEGYNNYSIYSTFDGNYKYGLGEDDYITITPQTGYKIWDQDDNGNFPYLRGIEAAAKVAEHVSNNSLYATANVQGSSHTASQINFLDSRFVAADATHDGRHAFLLEGVHWQYEARAKFEEDALIEGPEYGMDARKFAYLPIPRFVGSSASGIPDQVHDMNVVTMTGGGPAVTMLKNADRWDDDTNVHVLEVAKDFMLFLEDNSVLQQMAAEWRVLPSVTMKANEAEQGNLNPMVNNMVEILAETSGENAVYEICYLLGPGLARSAGKSSEYIVAAQSAQTYIHYTRLRTGIAGETIYMFNEFAVRHFNGQAISAKDWMDGIARWKSETGLNATKWQNIIRG